MNALNNIPLNSKQVHSDWSDILESALLELPSDYLKQLAQSHHWLPGKNKIFNAFQLPLANTRYVLLGESPYPRPYSANGFAFWDAAVSKIWSKTGLSTAVNRATSLRHIIKMLLVAEGHLHADTSQTAIAKVDKLGFVDTLDELFINLLNKGFLLLNASLVLGLKKTIQQEALLWNPFIKKILQQLSKQKHSITLLLFGKIAHKFSENYLTTLRVEHPYNISFIHNQKIIDFFRPLHLLRREK